MEKVNHLSE